MREDSRRRSLRPFLLLAAATAAGFGIALALADDAQAADRQPADGLLPTTASLTAGTADTAADLTDATQPSRGNPSTKPARQVVEHTTDAVHDIANDANAHVAQAATIVDQTTEALPTIGAIVDAATDLTAQIVDATPPLAVHLGSLADGTADPHLPAPGATAAAAGATTPANTTAPQTAPGPARDHPPLVTAGPGVRPKQHSLPEAGNAVAAQWNSKPRQHHQLDGSGSTTSAASPTGERHTGALAEQWQLTPRRQEPPPTGISHHDSRGSSPPPPSG